jgi:hypothetical protein
MDEQHLDARIAPSIQDHARASCSRHFVDRLDSAAARPRGHGVTIPVSEATCAIATSGRRSTRAASACRAARFRRESPDPAFLTYGPKRGGNF